MFEALRADPCRFVETLLDPRSLYRVWRAWRSRGTAAILAELSTTDNGQSTGVLPGSVSMGDAPIAGTLLVIDATLPRYDRDAGGRSSFLYLKMLREMGYAVFFMPNDQLRREPYASVLEGMGVQLLIGSGFRCGHWRTWLRDRAGQITHVILHRPNVAKRYLAAIKKIGGLKILYFAHDLRFLREARHYKLDGDAFHRHEADYWERIEKNIISQVDVAYFVSTEETRIVSTWRGRAVAHTVPIFPVNLAPCSGLPYEQRSGLLFVGGFAHQPNVDGILWFVNEIYPAVREQLGEVTLHVVGANPPEALRGRPGVVLAGAVSDVALQALYDQTRVAVAPLRYGAGIKGKVVEAVFQRVPMVTTSIGAEGMPAPQEVLEVCDFPHDFAGAVINLYRDQDLWVARSARMETYVAEHLSAATARRILQEDISAVKNTVPAGD